MIPNEMSALIQSNDGFDTVPSVSGLEATAPYLEPATVAVPKPGAGQVLIKVRLGSVNPSDIAFIKGVYGQPREKGKPAGFEGVGEVVATGSGFMARRLKGKRVAFAVGPNGTGSWAQYAIADAMTCIPLRNDVRDEDGAAMIVNPLTALAMFDIVRRSGSKAFVLTAGASQLCKLIINVARDEGYRAIAVVRREEQIKLLGDMGAAHVLNAEADEYHVRLAEVMKQEKPRVLLDAVTGRQASEIFHAMPNRARWVIYGRLDLEKPFIEEPGQMIFMQKRIEGFWLTEWMRRAPMLRKLATIREAQKRFASGAWKTDVTAIIPLNEVMDRLVEELAKPNGKVFIAP